MMQIHHNQDQLTEKIGHVPRPTFDTRNPLLPKFLYLKPGVGVEPCRIVSAGFEPKLMERPLGFENKKGSIIQPDQSDSQNDRNTHAQMHMCMEKK